MNWTDRTGGHTAPSQPGGPQGAGGYMFSIYFIFPLSKIISHNIENLINWLCAHDSCPQCACALCKRRQLWPRCLWQIRLVFHQHKVIWVAGTPRPLCRHALSLGNAGIDGSLPPAEKDTANIGPKIKSWFLLCLLFF